MLLKTHKKFTILCCIALAVLGILYGTTYLLCKIYLNPQQIKATLISQMQNRFKHTVTMADDVSLVIDWDMTPHLVLHDIAIDNIEWAVNKHLLTIDTLEIHFSLTKILFKEFYIKSLELTNPKLYLESNTNGNNWDFISKDIDNSSNKIKLIIDSVSIENGLVVYNQDKLTIDDLSYKLHGNNIMGISLNGAHNNIPIKTTFDLNVQPNKFDLDILSLQSGSSDLHGELSVTPTPLNVTGKFISKKLILKDFAMNQNTSASGEYVINSNPLPIDKLRNSEFNLTIKVDTLNIGNMNINNVTLNTKNVKNVLDISLSPAARIANGKISLNITYNINPQVPTFNLQAKTTTIQLETILNQMFGKSPIKRSTLDFSVNLSGSGTSLNAIVSSFNGRILAVVGPGDFLNADAVLGNVFTNILTSVITYNKQESITALKCGVLNFKVSNGIANAKNGIGMEAASVNVLGDGMIDLRNGQINFAITPQSILSGNINLSTFSVAQFVTVTGTINKPIVTLNPMNLLTQSGTALLNAGIATGLTGGINTILSGGVSLLKPSNPTVSPCKTALDS